LASPQLSTFRITLVDVKQSEILRSHSRIGGPRYGLKSDVQKLAHCSGAAGHPVLESPVVNCRKFLLIKHDLKTRLS
jgi:hypothetical protein